MVPSANQGTRNGVRPTPYHHNIDLDADVQIKSGSESAFVSKGCHPAPRTTPESDPHRKVGDKGMISIAIDPFRARV